MAAEVTVEEEKKMVMAMTPGIKVEASRFLLIMKARNRNTGISTPNRSTGGFK
jgi:hypothetical protein